MTDQTPSTTTRLLNFFGHRSLKFVRAVAKLLAGFVNILHVSKTSRTIRLNMEICFPDMSAQQREKLTQDAIRNELQSYMEFFSIWGSSTEKNLSRIRTVHGEAYFHAALAENKGLVLIVPHFGTWEIMNSWFAQYTRMTIMYKPIKNEDADQFVRQARSREQAQLVPTDESGVRQIFKALKQGGTTVILPDHTPHVGGDMVDFFGIPLASSSLSAKLIQKTKARALLLYAIRDPDSEQFDMYIEPLGEEIYQGSAVEGTAFNHQRMEQLIRHYPAHYHWSYKRFKAHPELNRLYNIPHDEALAKIKQLREHQQIPQVTEDLPEN